MVIFNSYAKLPEGMGKDMEHSGRRWKTLVKSGNLWDRKMYGKRYAQL
jgi:hypothetical protein